MSSDLYINELLSYSSYYVNNSNVHNIKKIITNFYDPEEVLSAKKLLWDLKPDPLGQWTDRKTSEKRSSAEANINDIFDALLLLDSSGDITFVALNMEKIPERHPEEINLVSMINRISDLEKKIKENENTLSAHEIDLFQLRSLNLEKKYNELHNSVQKIEAKNKNVKNMEARHNHKPEEPINRKDNAPHEATATNGTDLINNNDENENMFTKISKNENSDEEEVEDISEVSLPPPSPFLNKIIDAQGYELAESKARRRKRLLEEKKDLLITGAPPPIKKIFVGRILDGDHDSIRKYLSACKIKAENIELVSHRDSKYKSYKISIAEPFLPIVLGNFWPSGVICKEWKNSKAEYNQSKFGPFYDDKKKGNFNEYYNSKFKTRFNDSNYNKVRK